MSSHGAEGCARCVERACVHTRSWGWGLGCRRARDAAARGARTRARSKGATAVLARAPDPPAHASCTLNSLNCSSSLVGSAPSACAQGRGGSKGDQRCAQGVAGALGVVAPRLVRGARGHERGCARSAHAGATTPARPPALEPPRPRPPA